MHPKTEQDQIGLFNSGVTEKEYGINVLVQ